MGHDGSMPSPDSGAAASCTNPTATQVACAKCAASMCASVVSMEATDCAGAFDTCFAKCSCTDSTCIDNCATAAPAACLTDLKALLACQTTGPCVSACTPAATDSGITTTTDSGAAGSSCKNPTPTQTACGECEASMCASAVSGEKSACATFNTCFDACDCSATSCIDACAEAAPTACQTALESLETCETTTCKSACSGDAGAASTKDSGSSGGSTIPDCESPTSTEQTDYTKCLTCDTTYCAADVTAAVGACTTYYACVASTACSATAAQEACYTTNVTGTCLTAIDTLGACQDTFCLLDCAAE